jgi:hypothetical protein
MSIRRSNVALALGPLALVAGLAPSPRAADEAATLKNLAVARAAVARKVADFFADPRLAAMDAKGENRAMPGADQVEVWTRRVVEARLDAATNRDERVAILTQDLERTRAIETRLKAIAEDEPGLAKLDALKGEYYRLDAEYRLASEKDGR